MLFSDHTLVILIHDQPGNRGNKIVSVHLQPSSDVMASSAIASCSTASKSCLKGSPRHSFAAARLPTRRTQRAVVVAAQNQNKVTKDQLILSSPSMKHSVFSSFARPSAPISMLRPDRFAFAGASSSCCYSIVSVGDHGSSRSASGTGGIHTSRREYCV